MPVEMEKLPEKHRTANGQQSGQRLDSLSPNAVYMWSFLYFKVTGDTRVLGMI